MSSFLATKWVLGEIGKFRSMASKPLSTRLQRRSAPTESPPDELLLEAGDGAPAESKKEACIILLRLHGKVFGQYNSVDVTPEWKCLGKQSGPCSDCRLLRLRFGLDLP